MLGPAEHSGLEKGAIDDQLPTALEQVEQANLALGPIEFVCLLDGHPRHAPAFGGEGVARTRQGLFLHEHLLARSRDGGKTWSIENPAEKGALIPVGPALHGVTPMGLKEKPWQDCPGGIDFTHPDFALTVRMTDVHAGASRFYYSTDRGKTWKGPFRLPSFDQPGIAARTDYLVNAKEDCLLFLTAAKQDRREGRGAVRRVEPYLRLELENTLVSNCSVSGHGGGDGTHNRPAESLSLNFTKIQCKATQMDGKNAAGSPSSITYDLGAAKVV